LPFHAAVTWRCGSVSLPRLTETGPRGTRDQSFIGETELTSLIRTHAALLVAGILTFAIMGAGQSLYGPALPAFAREFGLTVGQAGWLVSALWIGSATGVAVMFFRGRHVTPRHALGVMVVGAGIIALGIGWVPTLLGSVVFGMGYGISTVVFNPRVLRAFGAKGPSMVSLLNAMFAVGAILAPLGFVAIGSNPQLAFGVVAGICALIWLVAGTGERSDEAATATVSRPYRFRAGLLCFGVVCIGVEACLIGLGPTALITTGASEETAARALSGFFVAFLIARSALVFTAHLLPAFSIYAFAMCGAAACAIGASVLPAVPFFIAMGAFAGLFFPGFFVTASRLMGDDPRVTPTIIAAGLVGGISSPVILSWLVEGMGERGFFQIVAGVTVATAAAALVLLRRYNAEALRG
jgi:FHS family glucose/mannose:H+ symporter-like MFS transporter